MATCGIYSIVSPSFQSYVGQSLNIEGRFASYKRGQCKGQHRLYNSINKYGWDSHTSQILIRCKPEQLDYFEKYMISYLSTFSTTHGLNLTSGGRNCIVSDETRKKISGINKGRKLTVNQRKAISEYHKGRIGVLCPNSIKINQYSLCGKHIKLWDSASDAARHLCCNKRNISSVCRGERSQAVGFVWRFIGDDFLKYLVTKKGDKKKKSIIQFDMNNNEIKKWESAKHVQDSIGIRASGIRLCCNDQLLSSGGYIWKYQNESDRFRSKRIK